jgi:hypothetical protein
VGPNREAPCKDAVFQEICTDYITCLKALAYWRESDEIYAARYAESYRTLRAQLELEILRYVNE